MIVGNKADESRMRVQLLVVDEENSSEATV